MHWLTGKRPFSWPLLALPVVTLHCPLSSSLTVKKIMIMIAKTAMASESLDHSFESSFLGWGRRVKRKVQEQQAYFNGHLCVSSSFLSHYVVLLVRVKSKKQSSRQVIQYKGLKQWAISCVVRRAEKPHRSWLVEWAIAESCSHA